jgi:hypothetical protein
VSQGLNDAAFADTVFRNFMKLYFEPEIEKRRTAGELTSDFVLMMAQVIFPEEGENEVRINDEVRGVIKVECQRAVQEDDQVLWSDLTGVQSFELSDEELDCGHITVIRRGPTNSWMVCFNALAGRNKAASLVKLAGEFLAAVKHSVELGHSGPAVDNLFSCCELLAKAELMMHRAAATKAKRHGAIGSAINQWGRLGNVHPQFVATMNRMASLRSAARYEARSDSQHMPTIDELEAVAAYMNLLDRRSAPRLD